MVHNDSIEIELFLWNSVTLSHIIVKYSAIQFVFKCGFSCNFSQILEAKRYIINTSPKHKNKDDETYDDIVRRLQIIRRKIEAWPTIKPQPINVTYRNFPKCSTISNKFNKCSI